ncbi:TetR/AcrR family transcriptional regulator [Actinokineospora globicatena]|uniref:TetR family transcriptional regulator n=1 Tax=Actinokineospora globicatena TaxID=103729 RepID=A0A9W6QPQ2_9PSEU|nr:TetR/AcrR family transcriptional regulator [Actinokineospora globicatena]GLW93417.1 TetR family transcriptional regulator [Actinokineospora globicatena]
MTAARGHEVRRRLLAAAVELVPERGWTAVSTRVLAERAGVTPSVVHYHFSSMQALLAEAVLGAMRAVASVVDDVLAAAESPGDAVDTMIGGFSGADSTSVLFVEAYLAAMRDERLRKDISAVIDGVRQRFGDWLAERGVAAPHDTAAAVLAALDGAVLHRGLGAGPSATALRRMVS